MNNFLHFLSIISWLGGAREDLGVKLVSEPLSKKEKSVPSQRCFYKNM